MRSSGFDPIIAEIYSTRLRTVMIVVSLVFCALALRLWYLQIHKGPDYRVKSENNRIALRDIPPVRGMIFDRDGELLVDNRPSYHLYIIPEEIQDRQHLKDSLEKLIGLPPETIEEKLKGRFRNRPFKPVLIKESISRDELAVIETSRFNLPGVTIQVMPQRQYLRNILSAHVIGYVGEISEKELNSGRYPDNISGDFIGKSGVEASYQGILNGHRGGEQVEVDAAGRTLRVITRRLPEPGSNLFLTIDKDLQMVAEHELKDKKGAIVALDPSNGEILALANSPAFDPNLFVRGIGRDEWSHMIENRSYPLQNRAISGQYPPGSVFKIVMALAALEEGIIDPEDEIFCSGSYFFGNRLYRCWRRIGHGAVNFHKALRESCDVYFYTVGRELGVDKIAYYAAMFGLGEKTKVGLGNEKAGLIPTKAWKLKRWGVPWQPGETISTSIGQSFVLTTPLQLAGLISATFNGGIVYQPKLIRSVQKDGENRQEVEPVISGRIKAKKEHLELVKKALIAVVNEPRGTGSKARFEHILVAGKTGTAQVVNLKTEKSATENGEIPEQYRDHAWFVAIAPADEPRLALAIVVEHGGHGGSAAAPIAQKMIDEYLGREWSDFAAR